MTSKVLEMMRKFRRIERSGGHFDSQNHVGGSEGLSFFKGRSILISGAGGTVGTELCRQLLAHTPARLVLVERSELNLSNLLREIEAPARRSKTTLQPALECVLRTNRMLELMTTFDVSVVLHAAAYKHVPMIEAQPLAGIENNLFGTLSLAQAALGAQVDKFLLVSTDKAISPNGMLGASKLLAELAIWDLAEGRDKTQFSAVRFGNVYGSSGSVVPIWKRQIAREGVVTVTDPRATRYFMTVEEAAHLVLQSVTLSTGRDLFALDMGPPRSILSLAKEIMAMAEKSYLPIAYTGLRPGERLHEPTPITASMEQTGHPRILRSTPDATLGGDIRLLLRGLSSAVAENDSAAVQRLVDQWVFSRTHGNERRSV